MFSVGRMQIRHFRRFRQNGPFLAGDKNTVYQKHGLCDCSYFCHFVQTPSSFCQAHSGGYRTGQRVHSAERPIEEEEQPNQEEARPTKTWCFLACWLAAFWLAADMFTLVGLVASVAEALCLSSPRCQAFPERTLNTRIATFGCRHSCTRVRRPPVALHV